MSDSIFITLIICGTGLSALIVLVAGIGLFSSPPGSGSNFESFVKAWKEKRVAEIEVEKLQAQHEKVCPRLTDMPRSRT